MIGWRVALAVSAFVVVTTAFAQTQVTDATGRTIALPSKIERVYAAGPPAMVLVLALAPEKLVGWTRAPRDDERALLPDAVAALPGLGRHTGRGNTANVERVLQATPDVIVDVGSTSATYVTLAERIQAQTAIPYLLFDGALADTPRLLRKVGAAVGKLKRSRSPAA